MICVGLTGSIAMGKSTVLSYFAELGASVWDADKVVHQLYKPGGKAFVAIQNAFPDLIDQAGVDRNRLGALAAQDAAIFDQVSQIVHPLVVQDREDVQQKWQKKGVQLGVFDVPLLFETDIADQFASVIVVTASAKTQRQRALARPHMTEEKLTAILAQQMPDKQKQQKANFVIETDISMAHTKQSVEKTHAMLLEQ